MFDLLLQHRAEIVSRWFEAIADRYGPETAVFLKKQQDQFANPIGHALRHGTAAVFDALVNDAEFGEPLERIVKIRAVQETKASEAVGFIFLLKDAVRLELGNAIRERQLWDDLAEFDSRIDRLALAAFDLFMASREKIYEIRAHAIERRYAKLKTRTQTRTDVHE